MVLIILTDYPTTVEDILKSRGLLGSGHPRPLCRDGKLHIRLAEPMSTALVYWLEISQEGGLISGWTLEKRGDD